MAKIGKNRRQDLIFQVLKGRNEDNALSAMEIEKALQNEDVNVNLRTVRRDLDVLTETHGLTSTEARPERYYPSKDYDLKYELHLNENTLQVLLIALNNLKFTSHDYFTKFAAEAETTIYNSLDSNIENDLRESKNKYHFDYSTAGRPISKNLKDFEKVMTAIREDRVITCFNKSPYKDEEYNSKRRKFAPYMFILTSGIPYLIVEDQDDMQIKKLRVTRIENVRLSQASFSRKNIEDKINLQHIFGGWGGIDDKAIEIRVTCDDFMATYFKEREVHSSQNLKQVDNDSYLLSLKCSPSYEIIRLISSYGGHIKKIEPKSVREQVVTIWKCGLELFSGS